VCIKVSGGPDGVVPIIIVEFEDGTSLKVRHIKELGNGDFEACISLPADGSGASVSVSGGGGFSSTIVL
jgi:hypothetical protein